LLICGYYASITSQEFYHDSYVFNENSTRFNAKNLNNLHIHSPVVAAVVVGGLSLPADTIFAACKK